VAQVTRCPSRAEARGLGDFAKLTSDVCRVWRSADSRDEDQAVILPEGTGRQPVLHLPLTVLPERLDGRLRQRKRPSRLGRLGIAALAYRTPHGDRWRNWPGRARISVQVDVIPEQSPSFLSADADGEAQHDVGVQPGRPGCFEERKGLVQREGPAWPTYLSFGRVDQSGHVPAHKIVRLGIPDCPRQGSPCDLQIPGREISAGA
jgi:hypothetical protein